MNPLTNDQRKQLERLWFLFGNNGPKHTHGNHGFIQGLLQRSEDDRDFYRRPSRSAHYQPLTDECEQAVDAILKGGST